MNPQSPIGKTKTQGWEIGVSRTLPISTTKAWDRIVSALGVDVKDFSKGAAFETRDRTRVEIRSFESGSLIRMTWQPPDWDFASTLQVRVTPAKTGATISVHHEKLQNGDQREQMRARWTALLEELKASVSND